MKKYGLLCFIVLLSCFAFGQAADQKYLDVPIFGAASPDAASIGKFGNLPVTLTNGSTSVSVPVWDIKCGSISWPVSIAYNTGGIRVDEISSNIGTGWALTGTGVITRTVMGRADEETNTEPIYENVSWADWDYLYHVLDGVSDSEYDIYSYTFNGKSGKFYITQSGQFFAVPYTTLKFSTITNGFKIIDENGNIYTFDKKETTSSSIGGSAPYTSSWFLTKVQTADTKQSIDFNYTDNGYITRSINTFSQGIQSVPPAPTCAALDMLYQPVAQQSSAITNSVCQLNSITFPNGSINFTYVNDRADITGTGKHRLTTVDIKQAGTNKVVKKLTMSQSYFTPGNRLKLNSISESGYTTSGPVKNYTFEYNSTPMVPVGSYAQDIWGFNNGKTSNPSLMASRTVVANGTTYNLGNADRSVDTVACKAGVLTGVTWPTGGKTVFTYDVHQYYTGFNQIFYDSSWAQATALNQTVTATFTYPSVASAARAIIDISQYNYTGSTGIPYVQIKDMVTSEIILRVENTDAPTALHSERSLNLVPGRQYEIKSFVFTSTTNPNYKSSLKVKWETYGTAPVVEKGGGLRIRKVDNYTNGSVLAGTDYYDYDPGTTLSSYYFINLNKKTVKYKQSSGTGCECTSMSSFCDIYYSNSIYPATTIGGSPVMYKNVRKYQLDGSGNNKGKVEYEFNVIRDEIQENLIGYSFVYFTKNDWKNGTLLSEKYYKAGSNTPIKKIENQYIEIKPAYIQDLQVKTLVIYLTGCFNKDEWYAPQDMSKDLISIYTGVNKLKSTTETTYDDAGSVLTEKTDYAYTAASHDFLTKSIKTNSKGETIANELKYPGDFAATGNVYEKMVNKNIVSPVIESKYFKEITSGGSTTQTLLSTVKNEYRDWKNDALVLAPEFVKSSLYAGTLKNQVVYTDYNDRKLPLEVKKDQDATTAVIYGYNYAYPIAEVTNANQASIAYTSFEGDNGGWTISGSTIKDPTAPTGQKAFQFSSIISKVGVPTTNSYIVSYWKKSGTVTISGSTVTTGRTVNGWTYYEHKIASPAPSTISVTGSSAIIDELRLYPGANSLMTTYIFDPLVGLTSKCDANNRITYYLYDELQRLILVRDQDKKILKKYSYKYQGLTEFTGIYTNVAKTGNFQKTGCSGCNVGSVVTYSVPADYYLSTVSQAEADALAQADINANGQAYANATGTCGAAPDAVVQSTITISKSVQYTFYNRCTGVSYVRNRTGNETDWPMAGIPQGNYDVTFNVSPVGSHTFKVITTGGTFTNAGTPPLTIYNVTFDAATSKVTVTP